MPTRVHTVCSHGVYIMCDGLMAWYLAQTFTKSSHSGPMAEEMSQVKVSQSKLSEIADCQNVQIAPVFRIYFFGRLMDGLEHCVKTREILGFRHSRSMCRALGQSLSFNKKTNFEHAIIAEKPHGVSHVIEAARTVGKSQCHD